MGSDGKKEKESFMSSKLPQKLTSKTFIVIFLIFSCADFIFSVVS